MTHRSQSGIRKAVESHLPALRRFAWAYSGSRSAGDAAAMNLLKGLRDQPSSFYLGSSVKLRLFKRLYNQMSADGQVSDVGQGAEGMAGATLGREVRTVFLLFALEGFGSRDIADIIDQPESRAKFLMRRAETLAQSRKALDVLIIEDEALIAMELKAIVEKMGHRVIGRATTHAQAVMFAKRQRPDIVLADVQLAQGSCGIDAVSDLRELSVLEPVFVTAFPNRVSNRLTGSPLFIVSKPFSPNLIETTLSQAAMQHRLDQDSQMAS